MKVNSILTLAVAIPFALAACSDKKSEPEGGSPDSSASATTDAYPLTTCVVSGEELGTMGKPVEIVHEGTTVKFCCKSCIPDFEKEPAKYLAKLKQ
jgi:YHS domain-containing protein